MNVAQLPSKIAAYTRPKPSKINPGTDTKGDLPGPSVQGGAIAGAVQGLISGSRIGGIPGAVAGAISGTVGGYVGVAAGMKARSFPAAILAGTAAGAATAAVTSAGLSAMFGAPITIPMTAGMAVLGGLTGAVGTLSGSKRAETRDSVYGGYLGGMIAEQYVGNPFLSIATAAGAGAGGRAVTPAGRAVLGAVTGAAAGALAGVPFAVAGFPNAQDMIVSSAIAGAIVGPIGAVVGPVARQVTRNAQDDASAAISAKLDPIIAKHPLTTAGKAALGVGIGVLTMGPLGMLAPAIGLPLLPSLAVTSALGGAVVGTKVYRAVKKQESFKAMQAAAKTYAGQYGSLQNVFARPPQTEPAR